jgi:hypothetical protein
VPPFSTDASQQCIFILLQESMVSAVLQLRGQGLEERESAALVEVLFQLININKQCGFVKDWRRLGRMKECYLW